MVRERRPRQSERGGQGGQREETEIVREKGICIFEYSKFYNTVFNLLKISDVRKKKELLFIRRG